MYVCSMMAWFLTPFHLIPNCTETPGTTIDADKPKMYTAISEMLAVLHRPLAVLAEGMGLSPLQTFVVVGMMVTGTQRMSSLLLHTLLPNLIYFLRFKEHLFNGNFSSHITITITTNAKNDEMIHLLTLERKYIKIGNPIIPLFLSLLAVLVFMENTRSFEYSGSHTVRGAPRSPIHPQPWQQHQYHSSMPTETWRTSMPLGRGLHMQPHGHSEHQNQMGQSVPRTSKPTTFPSSSRQPRYSPRQQQTHHNHSWQQQQSPGRSPRNGFRQPTQTSSKPINMTSTNAEALVTLQSIGPDDQLVVVLVGLPGCGKSTVAAAIAGVENRTVGTEVIDSSTTSEFSHDDLTVNYDIVNELPPPQRDIEEEGQHEHQHQSRRKWVVTCQDILKTRKKVLVAANRALMNGHSVIIDRCNFDVSQRATWLTMAAEYIMQKNSSPQSVNSSLVTEVEVTTTASTTTSLKQDVSYQEEVDILCSMGFDPVQSMLAIQSSHGDIETAAAMLLSSSMLTPPPATLTTVASSSSGSMHLKSLLKIDTTSTTTNPDIVGINSPGQEADEPLLFEDSEKRGFNRLLTIGIVLPRPNDVAFCSNRAFGRGNDGIHDADTDWSMVCERMNSEFQFPAMDEGFDGIYYCSEESDLQTITAILRSL